MLHMVDDCLSKFRTELRISDHPDDNGRFYVRQVGSIDVKLMLRIMGVKGGLAKNATLLWEIGSWEKGLMDDVGDGDYVDQLDGGHIRWRGFDVPHFLANRAFKICGGKIAGIRKEDETVGYFPLLPGQILKGEKPRPNIIKADWVK